MGITFLLCFGVTCRGADRPVSTGMVPVEEQVVTLTAVGDVVMHTPIVDSAFDPATGAYDFRPIFTGINQDLLRSDLAVGVLESPLAGPEEKYTGYPRFNAPGAIADALKWAGLDLVFTAHNHCLDRGISGLESTLAYLDQIGLPYVGGQRQPKQARYRIVAVKGIRLAFLSYTTITNGIATPSGWEWAVNRLDFSRVAEDIAAAKRNGADGIIMAMHTGTEYQRQPSPDQRKLIDRLLDMGVDIILGSHVHVVQPLEVRQVVSADGGPTRTCVIAYSLGNFLSNQRWRYSDSGLMLQIRLEKRSDGPGINVVGLDSNPLWVHRYYFRERPVYRILKLDGPVYLGDDPNLDILSRQRIREVWEDTAAVLGNAAKGSQESLDEE